MTTYLQSYGLYLALKLDLAGTNYIMVALHPPDQEQAIDALHPQSLVNGCQIIVHILHTV